MREEKVFRVFAKVTKQEFRILHNLSAAKMCDVDVVVSRLISDALKLMTLKMDKFSAARRQEMLVYDLAFFGPQSVRELMERWGVTRPTATSVINIAHRMGYVDHQLMKSRHGPPCARYRLTMEGVKVLASRVYQRDQYGQLEWRSSLNPSEAFHSANMLVTDVKKDSVPRPAGVVEQWPVILPELKAYLRQLEDEAIIYDAQRDPTPEEQAEFDLRVDPPAQPQAQPYAVDRAADDAQEIADSIHFALVEADFPELEADIDRVPDGTPWPEDLK